MLQNYAKLLVDMYRLGHANVAEILLPVHTGVIDSAIAELQFGQFRDRHNLAVRRYYGLGAEKTTLKQLAQEFQPSVTQERVRQIIRAEAFPLLRSNYKLQPVVQHLLDMNRGAIPSWYEAMEETAVLLSPEQLASKIASEFGRYDIRLENLHLSRRSFCSLLNDNITTLGELLEETEASLMRMSNFGVQSLAEIKVKLKELNLELAD